MNYVLQLNAFCEKAVGKLDAKEQAMYLRLFYIANRLGWPEWFSVANSQLMRELQIKSKDTARAVRRSLIDKGFIQAIDPGHKQSIKYRLVPLVQESKGLKNSPLDAMGLKNSHQGTKNYPHKGEKIAPSININSKQSTTSTEPPPEENADWLEVVKAYQENISLMASPIEMQKLMDDVEHYGKTMALKAIERCVIRNKRSLGMVEYFLREWAANGYDEPNEKKGRKQYAGKNRNSGNRQQTRGNAGYAEPGSSREPETSDGLQRLIDDMERQDANHVYPWDIPDDDSGGGQSSS